MYSLGKNHFKIGKRLTSTHLRFFPTRGYAMHPRLISCVELVARVSHLLVAWPLAAKISFESDDVGKLHESYTPEDE